MSSAEDDDVQTRGAGLLNEAGPTKQEFVSAVDLARPLRAETRITNEVWAPAPIGFDRPENRQHAIDVAVVASPSG